MWWVERLLRVLIGALILILAVGTVYYLFTTVQIPGIEIDTSSTGGNGQTTKVNYPPQPNRLEAKFRLPRVRIQERNEGLGAFVDPGAMVLGNWYTLQFVAGPDDRAIRLGALNAKLTEPQPIYVSRHMRVTLLPTPNFEPQRASRDIQDTGLDRTDIWQWNIKPLHDGTHMLSARVEAGEILPDGRFDAWDSQTRTVSIRVKIGSWEGFVRAIGRASTAGDLLATLFGSWEKTVTALALLIGALSTLWAAIRKLQGKPIWPRRRKKAA